MAGSAIIDGNIIQYIVLYNSTKFTLLFLIFFNCLADYIYRGNHYTIE